MVEIAFRRLNNVLTNDLGPVTRADVFDSDETATKQWARLVLLVLVKGGYLRRISRMEYQPVVEIVHTEELIAACVIPIAGYGPQALIVPEASIVPEVPEGETPTPISEGESNDASVLEGLGEDPIARLFGALLEGNRQLLKRAALIEERLMDLQTTLSEIKNVWEE